MIDQLVIFDTAKLAKEKGFDIISRFGHEASLYNKDGKHTYYSNYGFQYSGLSEGYIPAPTQSLLQRWLREKHDIHIIVKVFWDSKTNNRTYAADIYKIGDKPIMRKRKVESTYEEALEQGLIEALKLI